MYLLQNIPIIKSSQKLEAWQRKVMKFIWAGKKPRLKMKIMCDARERGRLQVPNFRIYHEAICLTWLSSWIMPNNKKLLNVKGYNKKYGWHTFLIHDKARIDNIFKHHYIQQPLLECWLKYKPYLSKEIPLWEIPRELLDDFLDLGNSMQYKDLLIPSGQKFELQLHDPSGNSGNWFHHLQLSNLFKEDREKIGFLSNHLI